MTKHILICAVMIPFVLAAEDDSPRLQRLNAMAENALDRRPNPAKNGSSAASPSSRVFSFSRSDGALEVHLNGVPVGTYLFEHAELTRPALVNLRAASGTLVTREFPAPEDADHRWMHPGVAMSFGWLDGQDYWRLKAPVKHAGFISEPEVRKDALTWATRNEYLAEDRRTLICLEEARYELSTSDRGLLWRIESEFFNPARTLNFGDQEESGLCVRLAPAFSTRGGGMILNDRGEKNEAGTWGREFRWIDASAVTSNGERAGILIIPDPKNARPCWSHSRDYGLVVANPFPRQPRERREPYTQTRVAKGERFRLAYSILVYEYR